MNEGWLDDDYLILFSKSEIVDASRRYGMARLLPGFTVVGLLGWDDLLVQDAAGKTYAIPAVPIDKQYLRAYQPPKPSALQPDERFMGKIKWYVTPLVFGGDPGESRNITWVTHEQHSQLVMWWNQQYDRARRADFKR